MWRVNDARRSAVAILLALCVVMLGGVAGVSRAHAATPTRVVAKTDAPSGTDPAERDAINGKLGYHENRNYPYGLIIFLVVLTPVVLVIARRWRPAGDAE